MDTYVLSQTLFGWDCFYYLYSLPIGEIYRSVLGRVRNFRVRLARP